MGLELATTTDLQEMESRLLLAIANLTGGASQSTNESLQTLSRLREKYDITEKSLNALITSKQIEVITHSNKPRAKRYFRESDIKHFFMQRPSE